MSETLWPDDIPYPVMEDAAGILDLAGAGQGRFRAAGGAGNHLGTVFGGRLLAQALLAAGRTVADMPATSLHAAFLAPGRIDQPIDYDVVVLRDSRRFANRQVLARQDGILLFTAMAAFHAPEEGYAHQQAIMPDVPPPEAVMPLQLYMAENEARVDGAAMRNFGGATPIELRPVAPESFFFRRSAEPRTFWFRMASAAPVDDAAGQQCLLAFASDYWLAGVAAIPHAFPTNGRALMISSMDHAIWFHGPARCEEWLLHHTVSPAAGDGLGLGLGQIFRRDGRLVATTAQECLLRRLNEGRAGGASE